MKKCPELFPLPAVVILTECINAYDSVDNMVHFNGIGEFDQLKGPGKDPRDSDSATNIVLEIHILTKSK